MSRQHDRVRLGQRPPKLSDRDPTGGVQTLYCIMRRQMQPAIQIRDGLKPFDLALVDHLVSIASA